MSDRDALVRAHSAGRLLEAIGAAISPDRSEREKLASDLRGLHNEGTIDLVRAFSGLRESSDAGSDFFLLRHVLEEVLPDLEAPVPETARCVLSLYREAGTDMAAGMILEAFREFCSRRVERVRAALAEIEAAPEDLADLLVPVLVAGARIDPAFYVDETIRLAGHPHLALRRRALFAIGRLEQWHGTGDSEKVVAAIERAVRDEDDDFALASVVKSASAVASLDSADEARLVAAIKEALDKGGEVALHAASEIFGFRTSRLSPDLLALVLEHLAQVEVANKGTLDNIDYGVAHLLREDDSTRGLAFLETVLRENSEELEVSAFDDSVRAIRETPGLRTRIATRWLLSGETVLCEGVETLLDSPLDHSLEAEVDPEAVAGAEPRRIVFLARKAVGYLFSKPITATSFLVSLLHRVPAGSVLLGELEALLFDPLLINYSAAVSEYLTGREESEEEPVRSAIRRALVALETYLDGLKAVGDLPALHPSLEHREAYQRHFAGELAQSLKKAQDESPLLLLIHRSVLLYGRKAIHHAFGPEGEIKRMETNLGKLGTQIDVPRLSILDPQGLDFMLRVFRTERMPS